MTDLIVEQKRTKNVFVNSVGKSFPISGMSPMEIERIRTATRDRFKTAGRRLEPPTYTTTAVDGTVQTFPHNENTVETDEDRAALAEYNRAVSDMEIESNTTLSRASILCVEADPMKDKRWVGRMGILNIPIPGDEFECLNLYVETEVLKSVEDIAGLMVSALYSGGTVDEGGVSAAEAAFRSSLSELFRNATA